MVFSTEMDWLFYFVFLYFTLLSFTYKYSMHSKYLCKALIWLYLELKLAHLLIVQT